MNDLNISVTIAGVTIGYNVPKKNVQQVIDYARKLIGKEKLKKPRKSRSKVSNKINETSHVI